LSRDVDFVWPNVTIGNNINAVRFAIKNKTHLLLNSFPVVDSYELLPDIDISKEEAWASLVYEAYNMGLVPFSGKIKSIRIEDRVLKVFTKAEKRYTIAYENINLFSLNAVSGLELEFDKDFCYNKVYDWFDVRSGGEKELSFDIPADSVIQSAQSYPSHRRDGYEYYDIYSISHLSDDQLRNYEYSDTYIKFMLQKFAKQKNLDLELWKREVRKIYEITPGQARKNINWLGDTHETF